MKFDFVLRLLLVVCLVSLHALVCASYFSGQDLSIKSKGRLEKKNLCVAVVRHFTH